MKVNMPKIKKLLKYLLFGLIIASVLTYYPGLNIKSSTVMTYTLMSLLIIIVVNRYIFRQIEGMSGLSKCNGTTVRPFVYDLPHRDDDMITDKVSFDNNSSSRFYINTDQPNFEGLPQEATKRLLRRSKDRYILKEYRNAVPHQDTIQLGRDRSYLALEADH